MICIALKIPGVYGEEPYKNYLTYGPVDPQLLYLSPLSSILLYLEYSMYANVPWTVFQKSIWNLKHYVSWQKCVCNVDCWNITTESICWISEKWNELKKSMRYNINWWGLVPFWCVLFFMLYNNHQRHQRKHQQFVLASVDVYVQLLKNTVYPLLPGCRLSPTLLQ